MSTEEQDKPDLIAAAPELLDALRKCVTWIQRNRVHDEPIQCEELARIAIAKAEGQS